MRANKALGLTGVNNEMDANYRIAKRLLGTGMSLSFVGALMVPFSNGAGIPLVGGGLVLILLSGLTFLFAVANRERKQ
jgi:hypothetical protein